MRLSLPLSALLLVAAALPAAQVRAAGPLRGELAPPVLGESDGKPVLLSDYRGKVGVVVFWKSTCTPCKDQMGAFEEFNKQYSPNGLQVFAVDVGDSSKDYNRLLRQVKRPTVVMAHDEGMSVGEAWGVYMLPNVWVVDPDGRVVLHHEGYVSADLPAIFEEIRGILAAHQPQATPAAAPAPAGSAPR